MAVTSFIKPIQTDKGVMYSFQSAIDDISATFNHDNKKFQFSKFALVRIPEMGAPEGILENNVQFLAPGETPIIEGISGSDYNKNLAESFQNYALNFEALLLSQSSYKASVRRTVAERVFWKWLKELGAIRYRTANTLNERDSSKVSDPRFVEEDEFDTDYTRVVKYMGEINAINSRRGVNAHTEIYIYVPTDVGTTPRVLFSSVADDNYYANMRVQNVVNDPLNVEYLAGRGPSDTHPFALSTKAFYDLDSSAVTVEVSDVIDEDSPVYEEGSWFDYTTLNSMYTDPAFAEPGNQQIRKTLGGTEVEYVRSKLDGVVLDWDIGNYKLANDLDGVDTFVQFSSAAGNDSRNFEFNAVLLYYDVYDIPADPGVAPEKTTNLYGVLFLDKVEDLGAGIDFFIPTTPKYKPDIVQKTNGNALAYKLNVKFDTSINEAAVDRSVNDYNTFSMDLYMDALSQMQLLAETYNENLDFIVGTKNEIDQLKTLFLTDANKREILDRIESISTSLAAAGLLVEEENTVMSLINDLYKKYNDILDNNTTINVRSTLDPITINRLVTRNQGYNLNLDRVSGDLLQGSTLALAEYTNFFKHKADADQTLSKNLVIRIDDTDVGWKNGQVFRIVFDSKLDPDIHDVEIRTDATGVYSGSAYGRLIGSISKVEFDESGQKPMYEVLCTDAEDLSFELTKIR